MEIPLEGHMPGRRAGVSCSLKTKVLFMISSAWCCGSYIDRVFQHRIDRFINFYFPSLFLFFFVSVFPGGLSACLPVLLWLVLFLTWAVPSGMYGIEGMGTHCISVWRLAGACGVHMKERFARLEGFPSGWILVV